MEPSPREARVRSCYGPRAPPPEDKIRKLELTGYELQAREEKLLDMWARKL